MPLQAIPVNITAFRWMPLITAFTAVLVAVSTLLHFLLYISACKVRGTHKQICMEIYEVFYIDSITVSQICDTTRDSTQALLSDLNKTYGQSQVIQNGCQV